MQLSTSVSTTNTAPTHFVALASLASTLLALAGLEQDDRDQNQRGDQLQNCNKNNHQVFPPTYLLPHGHKIHIVDLILPQRGADCKHKSRPAGEFAGIFPVGGIEFP